MTIDLQTLKCGECGSSVLKRTGLNEYTCDHCGSVTLVEDNVSDRLERVLNQVKNEAGRRLAAEEALRQKLMLRKVGIAIAILLGVVLVFRVVGLFLFDSRDAASGAPRSVVAAAVDRTIPVDGLKLNEPRQDVAVAKAIADLNYQGYIAHEFMPARPDSFESFAEAFKICTV